MSFKTVVQISEKEDTRTIKHTNPISRFYFT